MIRTRRIQCEPGLLKRARTLEVDGVAVPAASREPFREVFRRYLRFVGRTLKSLGVMDADLDDVSQDVFLVVHRRLAEFEGRSTLRSWLYAIAVRVAADYRKSAYVVRQRAREAFTELPAPSDFGRPEARILLGRALAKLDDDRRNVLMLHEIAGFSVPEAASILGCPVQTAYTRLHSARQQLGRILRRAQLGKSLGKD